MAPSYNYVVNVAFCCRHYTLVYNNDGIFENKTVKRKSYFTIINLILKFSVLLYACSVPSRGLTLLEGREGGRTDGWMPTYPGFITV
jgi:hypothetical protein